MHSLKKSEVLLFFEPHRSVASFLSSPPPPYFLITFDFRTVQILLSLLHQSSFFLLSLSFAQPSASQWQVWRPCVLSMCSSLQPKLKEGGGSEASREGEGTALPRA